MDTRILSRSFLSAITIFLSVFLFGCQPDYYAPTYSYPPYYHGTNNSYTPLTVATQYYTFENYNGLSTHLNQGTYLNIPSNAFVDKNGYIIQGRVTLAIKEIIKKSDMFIANISSVSDSALLESGGILDIIATHDNSILAINQGIHITASFPVKGATLKMQVFNGDTTKYGYTDWGLTKDSANNKVTITKDSTSSGASFYYNLVTNGLNWLSIDQFVNPSPPATIKISLTNTVKYSILNCAIIFPFSAVAMLNADTGTNNFIIANMPEGTKATIVIYAEKNGVTYADFIPTTISANMKLSATLTQITQSLFESKLKALD